MAGRRIEQLPEVVSERRPGETDTSYRERILDVLLFSEIIYLVRADGLDRKLNLDALRLALTPTG